MNIEGYTPEELLAAVDGEFGESLLNGEPLTFQAGTAQVLASFRRKEDTLVCELAHIDGGGEGVLQGLSTLFHRYAERTGLAQLEWLVHAASCAEPNLKLLRVLERRGFERTSLVNKGEVYRRVERVTCDNRAG